ncbi:hypothetical protein Daura_20510 [Dactylosporangium aurantiacum]|uniref:Secreted protein n=1 Tax=Dactylosporangium aurantiacum TaxID=35754 RepID=A0A9Q9MRB1_9ACTN|nr:hypothetical protein [Dactylosporangium aurantiacum]MDG6106149.1 hypothetical protein [Dactylosporangium aurantiacum]UWZ58347.1 hypothetical protein Daura_20510 [Dactylosporangium aurantiacum]
MTIRRRRVIAAATVAVAAAATTLVGGSPAFANVTVTTLTSGLNVRDCYHPTKAAYPGYGCTTIVASLENNLSIRLVCQHAGDGVGPQNDYYWDYILFPATSAHGSGEGYVTDWYVNTGVSSPPFRDTRVPICDY